MGLPGLGKSKRDPVLVIYDLDIRVSHINPFQCSCGKHPVRKEHMLGVGGVVTNKSPQPISAAALCYLFCGVFYWFYWFTGVVQCFVHMNWIISLKCIYIYIYIRV